MIRRIFVKRKEGDALRLELKDVLNLDVRTQKFLRYDMDGLTDEEFAAALPVVFSVPPTDDVFVGDMPKAEGVIFAVEYLPGQFDIRADSAAQCVQLLTAGTRPLVKCADVYAIQGADEDEIEKIKNYLINPVDSRECTLDAYDSLEFTAPDPEPVKLLTGFKNKPLAALKLFHKEQGFAMSVEDLAFVQAYFRGQMREPTLTELKVIDTYWSDHCRHTTFLTSLKVKNKSKNPHIAESFQKYLDNFNSLYEGRTDKYVSLMDMATIGAKILKKSGVAHDIDESPEINACTVKTTAKVDGLDEDWLVLFKNETHNHPTEIEPFGGAATCLGGAIRDPLSGRSYVYQSMRITGAGDINAPIEKTIKGKLPQRVISRTATKGFSSYGNQIGLSTGKVREYYHPGFVAKRLETGYVVGAAPASNVKRIVPEAGDIVMLIGGETGRDGCGGATGSSKSHDLHSIEVCGAEVQKGNAAIERKLQRLFRNPEVTRLIKRCNDFGAGGVSVAIGELSPGLDINLDAVPKKYSGLSATELAISESQERMAIVIAPHDVNKVKALCAEENLDATVVATVTDTERMRMYYGGNLVVDLERKFLDSNGVRQEATALISDGKTKVFELSAKRKALLEKGDYYALTRDILSDDNVASQKGMGEIFDSTIGAGSVLLPFGGKHQMTPTSAICALLPAHTDKCTVSACGFNPYFTEDSPYVGAMYSVITAVERVVAAGAPRRDTYLTMQEFFAHCTDPEKWGAPASALLGALEAQLNLQIPAIGGKDSMSGTFEKITVPPTLIAFAMGLTTADKIISNVFKSPQKPVYRYRLKRDAYGVPDFAELNDFLDLLSGEIARGNVGYTNVVEEGGAFAAVVKSCFGNNIGFAFTAGGEDLYADLFGDILLTADDADNFSGYGLELVGITIDEPKIVFEGQLQTTNDGSYVLFDGKELGLETPLKAFTGTFENVYPTQTAAQGVVNLPKFEAKNKIICSKKLGEVNVFIPVFPGNNCEYDTANRFELAGAKVDTFVIKNRNGKEVEESVKELVNRLNKAQIIAFPGGFSGGDEPDGSGKFIAAFFTNPLVKEAVENLLYKRDGLALGICNGFQALVKLGLLPYGKIRTLSEDSPTLTYNDIGRHMSSIVRVRVNSNLSPWLSATDVGDVFAVPISHGEGKFAANDKVVKELIERGQVATVYCDLDGNPTMSMPYNPNGSVSAIEGITSSDGRIYGKMGHAERIGKHLYKNYDDVPFDMQLFESGVKYFK